MTFPPDPRMSICEPGRIYLFLRKHVPDRKEQRRLERLPALGLRGPNDLTDTGGELVCLTGEHHRTPDGTVRLWWEFRPWDPTLHPDPDSVQRVAGWQHLLDEGFQLIDPDLLPAEMDRP